MTMLKTRIDKIFGNKYNSGYVPWCDRIQGDFEFGSVINYSGFAEWYYRVGGPNNGLYQMTFPGILSCSRIVSEYTIDDFITKATSLPFSNTILPHVDYWDVLDISNFTYKPYFEVIAGQNVYCEKGNSPANSSSILYFFKKKYIFMVLICYMVDGNLDNYHALNGKDNKILKELIEEIFRID